MAIYNGSTEIKDLYYGNQKIGEAYYGNTKVYSSLKGIPVRRYQYSSGSADFYAYLVGQIDVQSIVCTPVGNIGGDSLETTIRAINGTLGSSGSSITVENSLSGQYNLNYKENISVDGNIICVYAANVGSLYETDCYVYQNSVVGSISLSTFGIAQITSVSESSLSFQFQGGGSSYTATRDNSYLKYWTKDGLIE